MTACTREPSGSRASRTGRSSVISRPTHWATLWMAVSRASSLGKRGIGANQLPAAFHVDAIVAVDHDFADRLVGQEGPDRLQKVADAGFKDRLAGHGASFAASGEPITHALGAESVPMPLSCNELEQMSRSRRDEIPYFHDSPYPGTLVKRSSGEEHLSFFRPRESRTARSSNVMPVGALSQKLLNQVAAAKICLLEPGKKADAWQLCQGTRGKEFRSEAAERRTEVQEAAARYQQIQAAQKRCKRIRPMRRPTCFSAVGTAPPGKIGRGESSAWRREQMQISGSTAAHSSWNQSAHAHVPLLEFHPY